MVYESRTCIDGRKYFLDSHFFVSRRTYRAFLEFESIFEYYWRCLLRTERENPRKSAVDQQTVSDVTSISDTSLQTPAKVILFNDETHTFEEVIGQLIKALKCDTARAEALTWEVHNSGKAAVFDGPMDQCVKVSGVLEEIRLHTQIEM
jgi:ATP-dependent Clp protease adaptor protein ClpS